MALVKSSYCAAIISPNVLSLRLNEIHWREKKIPGSKLTIYLF